MRLKIYCIQYQILIYLQIFASNTFISSIMIVWCSVENNVRREFLWWFYKKSLTSIGIFNHFLVYKHWTSAETAVNLIEMLHWAIKALISRRLDLESKMNFCFAANQIDRMLKSNVIASNDLVGSARQTWMRGMVMNTS